MCCLSPNLGLILSFFHVVSRSFWMFLDSNHLRISQWQKKYQIVMVDASHIPHKARFASSNPKVLAYHEERAF